MEVITSINDGKDTEYGLVINQEELDVLTHFLGKFSMWKEKEIGYKEHSTYHMYIILSKFETETVQNTFRDFNIIVKG